LHFAASALQHPLAGTGRSNEPTPLEAARVLAQPSSCTEVRNWISVVYAFRSPLPAWPPTRLERQRLVTLYEQQLKSFENDAKSAEELVNQGWAERPAELDDRKLAAWMMVANVLLNLDETITKE
jgi:hypothetical protein